MSSTFSAESAASASDLNGLECEPSRSVKSMNTASVSSESIGQMSLFSEMSESLPGRKFWPTPQTSYDGRSQEAWEKAKAAKAAKHKAGEYGRGTGAPGMMDLQRAVSMSSAEVSPAKTSVSPERAQALKAAAAAYGQSTPELLAKFDPATSSWRTSQLCLDGALAEFSETWPRSGLMRSGIAYQLPPLVRLTDETDCGLWPTPVIPNGGRSVAHATITGRTAMHNGKKVQIDLNQAVKMWPTPTVKGNYNKAGLSAKSGDGLATAVFATPTARDYRHPGRSRLERTGGTQGECLPQQVGGALNPTWVEWLMGFPLGWTDCGASATQSSRKSRKSSGGRS